MGTELRLRLKWYGIASLLGIVNGALAQQSLNLGFEQLGAEGIERAWGWAVHSYSPAIISYCDSTEVKSGYYSLNITGSENPGDHAPFELVFFIEPSQIIGQEVQILGFSKAKNLSGNVFVQLTAVGAVADSFGILKESEQLLDATSEWSSFQVEAFNVPAQTHSLHLKVLSQASGSVWLDELSLKVNDQIVHEVAVAPEFSKGEINQILASCHSLSSVDPIEQVQSKEYTFGDLAAFGEAVQTSKIIALGESTHGTSEFFRLKHRLIQYAILKLGVRVIILEDNQLTVERINEFVLHGPGSAQNVVKGLFAVWNTQEMLALIKWIRKYNEIHIKDPVEFVGMDAQNQDLALTAIHEFLARRDIPWQNRSDSLLMPIREFWRDAYFLADSIKINWQERAEINSDLFKSSEGIWLNAANTTQDSLEVYWAIQNARIITQFANIQRSNVFEARDLALAENIRWHINRRPSGTKFIVWAHDSHIARGDAEEPSDNYFLGKSMGAYLSDWYREKYKSFALFTYEGTCLGTISYSNFSQAPFTIYTSPVGSLDEVLHQVANTIDSPNLFFNLSRARIQEAQWVNRRLPVRYVGYVAEDYGFGGRYLITKQFDCIFHIDQSTAAKRITH